MRPTSKGGHRPVVEVAIEKLVPGGFGLARTDQGALLVAGAAPGDVVAVAVEPGARPPRGKVVHVLQPGPGRRPAPCDVAARCGGCDLMHLAPEARLAAYEAMFREAMPPAWRGVELAVRPAPREDGYRTRARLALETKPKVSVGFRAARGHDVVTPTRCLVLAPELEAVRAALPAWLEGARGHGEARVALGRPATAAEPRRAVVDVSFEGELPGTFFARLERATAAGGILQGARVSSAGATRPAVVADPAPFMTGADGAPLELAPGGFAQASDDGNALLGAELGRILDAVEAEAPLAGARVVELFAGAGNFTCLLARRGAAVTAVESDEAAVDAGRRNLRARGLEAKMVVGDATTHSLSAKPRLVLLDPPRTGAKEATVALAKARPDHVVYISCDAPTLSRDLSTLLAAGYTLASVTVLELFPQTSHLETAVWLRAPAKGR